ncbi:MAG TPA: DUF4329 domain-containing protein [Chitinophagaceae bacterium]|nr:DUF4329 domain-containing protein [Chitinophagaceae bacterium]
MTPGERYKTKRAAAHAWGKEYGAKALADQRELGSSIYKTSENRKTYYSYNAPVQASEANPNIIPNYPTERPEGATIVAYIHIHYNTFNGNVDFSDPDRDFQTKHSGADFYLVTANGLLREVTDESGGGNTKTLSNDMPRLASYESVMQIYFGGRYHSEAGINTDEWSEDNKADDLLPRDRNGMPIHEQHPLFDEQFYPPGYGPPGFIYPGPAGKDGKVCFGCYINPPEWIKRKGHSEKTINN